MRKYLFTSESVSEGHPDKMADQISDALLDAILTQDKDARVACETLTKTGGVVLAGEISTTANVDFEKIVRDTVLRVGYNSASRLIERMEAEGLVSEPNHVGRREVLMDEAGNRLP